MSNLLQELKDYLKEMARINHVVTLLYWDMETQMPKCGFDAHSDALTHFSTEAFELSTSPKLASLLEGLMAPAEFDALDSDWKFIVKKMKKELDENSRIPVEVYSAFVQAQAEAGQAWQEAKQKSDFSLFAPHLQKMIDYTKELAGYTNPGEDILNVLLNKYEEGMDSATYDRLFAELKETLIPLVSRILAAPQPDDSKFHRTYPVEAQKKVQDLLLNYIGFDFDKGCVGVTEHPFTLNFNSRDVRVSNHYYEDQAIDPMFSAIHEGGHAIFEQNVNPALDGTVAGSCCYMGIHESQSRFYENILGRNYHFWTPVYKEIQALLPGFSDVTQEEFYHEINHVRNSCIRTMADEVTYCLHIILRYELEKAIFVDGVNAAALPAMWNAKMQEYLHITPANDAEGILQDMHWSDGSFGYFPSYLLGSIYDGMYLEELESELGNLDEILEQGRILDVTHWLNEKIHRFGSTRLPREIIQNVCHKEVSAKPLCKYFTEKYTRLYKL